MPYLTCCHGPLASAITGLLNTQPTARPSVAQVRGLLDRATQVRGSDLTVQVTQQATRPPRRVGAAVLGLVALLAVALYAGGFLTRLGTEPDPPSTRPAALDEHLTYGSGGYLAELSWGTARPGSASTASWRGGAGSPTARTSTAPRRTSSRSSSPGRSTRLRRVTRNIPTSRIRDRKGLVAYAEPVCSMIMDSAKMTGVEDAGMRYRALVPAKDAWDEYRTVHCVLYHADHDQLTRSFVLVE